MELTKEDLERFFPPNTDAMRLEALAKFIGGNAAQAFEQLERNEQEDDLIAGMKAIKTILQLDTGECNTDYERYFLNPSDGKEWSEPYFILGRKELLQAAKQALSRIIMYGTCLSAEEFCDKRKPDVRNPRPYIQFFLFVLLRFQFLGINPNNEKMFFNFLADRISGIAGTPTDTNERTNMWLKIAKKRIKEAKCK